MGVMTLPYDPAEDLTDRAAQEELLGEAFASGDANFIVAAVTAVARSRGVAPPLETASAAPRGERESGGPRLSTFLSTVSALGYKLALTPS